MPWDADKSTAADPDNPAPDEQLTADEWDAHVTEGHFPSDELNFGVDAGGDPVITDPQNGGETVMRYDRAAGSWVIDSLNTDRRDITDVGFQVGISDDQSLPTGTETLLAIDEIKDDSSGDAVSLDATNNVVNINQDGFYLVTFHASVRGLSAGTSTRYIVTFGGTEQVKEFPASTGGFEPPIGPYPIGAYISSGDTIKFSVYQDTGSEQVIKSASRRTQATVVKLG